MSNSIPQEYQLTEISNSNRTQLDEIGKFRLQVWNQETVVDTSYFQDGRWIEPLDFIARHWIVQKNGTIVSAARLTLHQTLEDNPDGYLWKRVAREVPLPVVHFCKLVVHPSMRGHGLGSLLNQVRLNAAKEMGAKSVILTASEKNTRILIPMGFEDTGIRETFPNRPGFMFRGLQYIF